MLRVLLFIYSLLIYRICAGTSITGLNVFYKKIGFEEKGFVLIPSAYAVHVQESVELTME